MLTMSTNAIRVIHPYRWNNMWVFDDEAVGLVRERFVAGIPEMIDRIVRDIPSAEQGFNLIFSDRPFPGAAFVLERLREEDGGNWYRWTETAQEGWLCPALFRYYRTAPARLYVDVRRRTNGFDRLGPSPRHAAARLPQKPILTPILARLRPIGIDCRFEDASGSMYLT
jgi:hypothetical protein